MQGKTEDTRDTVQPVKRQAYVPPRLVEVGQLSDLTQSNGNNVGGDSGYS